MFARKNEKKISASVCMAKQAKEEYHLYVSLKIGEAIVERVPCKIYLPKRFSDHLSLQCHPSKDQKESLWGSL
jgi:hypothetical protein